MRLLKFIRHYFAERLTPLIRFLHYVVLLLVLVQIILSNFMEVNDGKIGKSIVEFYSTWGHIVTGLSLVLVVLIFIYIEFKKHGFIYFFPYFFGDFTQIKLDIAQLKSFQFPDLNPKGLAAIVQCLGLGALFLVVLSGFTWFIMWQLDLPFAEDVKAIHGLMTGLIEAYVVAHGSMGVIHLFMAYRRS